jgi:Tol biopolymer transport system component
LATGDPIQITFGDISAVRPRWSPRGDRIVFTRPGGGIWSVPPLGGEPRQVVQDGSNGDLSSDGHRLVFERSGQILIASADGTGAAPLPRLPEGLIPYYGDAWPTFSPDGKWIATFRGEEGRYGDYWIIPSEGGEPRRLTSDFQEGGVPAWSPDGKSLVVASARTGSVNLWRVPVGGGVPEALTTGTGEDLDPVVSHDGRTLLFANVKRTWAMVVHDVNTGLRRTLLEKRTPLVFPRYSADGRRIALAGKSSRGDMQVLMMNADGTNLTAVTDGAGELNVMPQWSGNDATLYFYQMRPTLTFRRISVSGGVSRQVAPWSFRREYQAAVDPWERLVVYSAVEQGRLQQSREHDLESGRETGLPFALYEQRFSRDGRFIAGESRDHEVVVCETVGRCRVLTAKSARSLTALAWSADDSRLFFLRYTSARVVGELTSVSVHGGREKAHGPIGPFERDFHMAMDVSPHDEIVFVTCHESPHELWMARLQ